MWSNIEPFEKIIEGVKDETGIINLENNLPKLRRILYRVQNDLGFGGSLVMRKKKYTVANGGITASGHDLKIRLPENMVAIEEYGSCHYGLCPGAYTHQGNYLFICAPKITEFTLVYYAHLCDGNGNPVIDRHQLEASILGISYMLYKPKVWNGTGNVGMRDRLKREYEDSIGEAIGHMVMPTTQREWSKIAGIMNMSSRDIMAYDIEEKCYCSIPECAKVEDEEDSGGVDVTPEPTEPIYVYYWQYNNLVTDISDAPNIDQAFLDLQNSTTISEFKNGFIVPYETLGRLGFAITNTLENAHRIFDVFGVDITETVFNTYYDALNSVQIYISKEYYVPSNIYFKFT